MKSHATSWLDRKRCVVKDALNLGSQKFQITVSLAGHQNQGHCTVTYGSQQGILTSVGGECTQLVASASPPTTHRRPLGAGSAAVTEQAVGPSTSDGRGAGYGTTPRHPPPHHYAGGRPAHRRPTRSLSESSGERERGLEGVEVREGGGGGGGAEGRRPQPPAYPHAAGLIHHHHHHHHHPGQHGGRARTAGASGGVLEMGIKSMEVQDDSFVVETVEIIKRPGQTLGFYIREGNGFDRFDGVFISRIQMGTVAESNGLLHVGDEIMTVNNVRVSNMSLDDVVILMSIPKKLVLTIRTRRNCNKNKSCPSLALTEKDETPVVVLKKGRSSSATALELTEKCPDAFETYVQHPLLGAEYLQAKQQGVQDRAISSRYASIFISPDKAQARLLTDEGMDSGNSSDGSLPRSVDSGKDRGERPERDRGGGGGGGGGYGLQDLGDPSGLDSPGSYLSPSATMAAASMACTGGVGTNFVGDREYLKYLIPDSFGRKAPPKSPSKPLPLAAHQSAHGAYLSEDNVLYSEPPYMNIGAYRDGLPASHRSNHEDRKSQERLRDLLHGKSRYNRLLRSRSPECYNSDSEVIFTHQRPPDSRGFASDYETYAGAMSDDDGPVYSIPRIPSSSSSELEVLLQKFTSLSHELQQEQSKLQRQLSSKGRPGQMTLPRQAEPSVLDAYGHRTLSGRASPGTSRRGVSTGTQTPAGVQSAPRLVRKSSTESPYLYRQFTLDDGLEAAKEQQQQQQQQRVLSTSLPLSAGSAAAAERSKQLAESASRSAVRLRDLHFSRKPLHIPYSEFEPYKADIHKRVEMSRACGLDGMLNIHIMSGQGLKSSKTSLRDLYCVVAVDSLNKARTMIRTGAINFDWDEAFDVDLEDSKEVSFLIYHWDPSYKHRLCFHGSVLLPGYVSSGQRRYVAIKMEPKGILFVTLLYKEPALSLQRLPSVRKNALFGVDLETVIKRENSGFNVPLLVKKCVEEVEARGLETVGIYRLCGSARRKIMLREAFEKNAAAVDLSPENVSDIHVVTGVLKDYLRELPEPLFTNALYQMLLDALSVRLPSDPEGSAKLMLSILECLPTANQDTMALILNHLRRVSAHTEKNKMTIDNLAICFGPVLL
ncbi:rho GTPase-activating protein 100F-like, partial [Babylonia areolata]|uniref:rho GTPase-activating protein 100F-like n=1 Tax=Babylonia areolata TaxID=304850 RepID=UPI003FCF3B69